MKIIKRNKAIQGNNSEKCKTTEYSFGDKEIDLGVATITGRYPDEEYAVNHICKELVYVIEGSGKIHFENESINFSEEDSILIEKNEKYFWNTEYCKVSMTCTPAWNKEQYGLIK